MLRWEKNPSGIIIHSEKYVIELIAEAEMHIKIIKTLNEIIKSHGFTSGYLKAFSNKLYVT